MTYPIKLTILLMTAFALIALTLYYFWFENNVIRVVRYTVAMPVGFAGFKIVQVSDLHNHRFGREQRRLMRLIEREKPDMIAVTGDLIHNEYTDNAMEFARRAVKLCPVYYVNGNHECILAFQNDFYDRLRAIGVTVLDNEYKILQRNGDRIRLIGLSDPMSHVSAKGPRGRRGAAKQVLDSLTGDGYQLLLSHRPEMFDDYANMDLVLTGHAHAGQVRLPCIGALITPGEGFRPKYDVGRFEAGKTTMLVSGGLGSSNIVPRINNRPQMLVITGSYFS